MPKPSLSDCLRTQFGLRLRQLRESAHMAVTDLADASGVSRQMIHALERGAKTASWETVTKLASGLGVTPDSFLEPEENSRKS